MMYALLLVADWMLARSKTIFDGEYMPDFIPRVLKKHQRHKSLRELIMADKDYRVTVPIDNAGSLWTEWRNKGNLKLLNQDWRLCVLSYAEGRPQATFSFPREPQGKEVHMLRMYLMSMGAIKRSNPRVQRIQEMFMMREEKI